MKLNESFTLIYLSFLFLPLMVSFAPSLTIEGVIQVTLSQLSTFLRSPHTKASTFLIYTLYKEVNVCDCVRDMEGRCKAPDKTRSGEASRPIGFLMAGQVSE
ncbi:MAG: hypothetical protein KDC85_00590 [Saprospiraceae bacterium]|nr:hypothetical protein [Saprospiraceae bacterium]MCB9326071.1 hypothetical protein [Lewinellaceae bacterium]